MSEQIPMSEQSKFAEKHWDQLLNVLLTAAIIALGGAVIRNYAQMEARKEKLDTVSRDLDRLRNTLDNRTQERYTKSDAAADKAVLNARITERTTDRIQRKEADGIHKMFHEELHELREHVAKLQTSIAELEGKLEGQGTVKKSNDP